MAEATESIEIKATPKACFDIVCDFESYPEFLKDVRNVTTKTTKGVLEVTYELDLIKSISYTLKMKKTPNERLDWTFVKGDMMRDNKGYWLFESTKKGVTKATYHIDISLGLLVPGAITKKLVEKSLPDMMKAFKKRIESES